MTIKEIVAIVLMIIALICGPGEDVADVVDVVEDTSGPVATQTPRPVVNQANGVLTSPLPTHPPIPYPPPVTLVPYPPPVTAPVVYITVVANTPRPTSTPAPTWAATVEMVTMPATPYMLPPDPPMPIP